MKHDQKYISNKQLDPTDRSGFSGGQTRAPLQNGVLISDSWTDVFESFCICLSFLSAFAILKNCSWSRISCTSSIVTRVLAPRHVTIQKAREHKFTVEIPQETLEIFEKNQTAPPVLLILWRSFAFGGSMFRAELNPDLTISTLRNSKQILRWQRLRQTQVELENVWPNWSNLVVVFLFFSRWSNSSIFNLYGPNDLWKLKNFGMHSVFWWWSGDVSYEEIHQQRTS